MSATGKPGDPVRNHRAGWRWFPHAGGAGLVVAGCVALGAVEPSVPAASGPPPDPGPFPWTTVTEEGIEFLPASEVAAFYRFQRIEAEGPALLFRSPTLTMRWEAESPMLTINDTNFVMATPCLKRGDELMISRPDLVKWIDPLLRPSYLPAVEWFDTVVIDPGHGGLDVGTRGAFGDEKTYTLDLARRLKAALRSRGVYVIMTRETDTRVDKQVRGLLASEVGRSVLVSLHFNADRTHRVRGIETYAMTPLGLKSSNDQRPGADAAFGFQGNLRDSASLAMAAAVHSQILHRTRCEDRGVRRARFAVLKQSERAAILIEGGYLSHPVEGALINQADYRATLANAIAEGILHYRRAIEAAP